MNKFIHAFTGLFAGFMDRSIMLQWLIVIAASLFFLWLEISMMEWCVIMICFGIVVSLEYVNTVVEHIMDFQHNQYHPKIKQIKDLSAGSVLVGALMSLIIGVLITLNHM